MQTGDYIEHRMMVEIIRDICAARGIAFKSLSDDWLLELSKNGSVRRVLGYKFSLNDSVASSISSDKVAAHLVLKMNSIPSVEHVLLRPPVSTQQKKPLYSWEKIVVKPLEGSGGQGVKLCSGADEAIAWIESTGHPAWAAAPFLEIEREVRVVLLDQKPLIVFEKQGVVVDGLKMFNLGKGATPKEIEPDDQLLSLAVKAQEVLDLRLCAVDIVETVGGDRMVLEVNSGFSLEHFMRHSVENKRLATNAYKEIIAALFA